MADSRIKFIATMDSTGLKRGAKEGTRSLQDMSKAMETTAAISKQKYLAAQEEAAKATARHKQGVDNFKASLGFAAAAVGVASVALKKWYDIAGEGAQIELATLRFDRLAESIGTTANSLKYDLEDATEGLLSNAEQIKLSGDLIALGLVTTHDQAVRLTRIVAQLGIDTGELALALANQTTKRFDQMGIAAVGFTEKLEALEEQGYSTDEAFTEAFLQQGEEQIDKVGGISETSAGKLLKFEAVIKDVGDSLKVMAAGPLVDHLETWTKIYKLWESDEIGFLHADLLTMASLVGLGRDKVDELYDGMVELTHVEFTETELSLLDLADAASGVGAPAMEELGEELKTVNDQLDEVNQNIFKQGEAWAENREWVERGGLAYQAEMERIMKEVKNTDKAIQMMNETTFNFVRNMAQMEDLTLSQIQEEFEDLGIDAQLAYNYALAIRNQIENIDGLSASADIWINVHGKVPKIGSFGGGVSTSTTTSISPGNLPTIVKPTLQQAGGDFVVPPQYTGDSFPVRATAGERVRVDTASNTAQEKALARLADRRNIDLLARKITEGILAGVN